MSHRTIHLTIDPSASSHPEHFPQRSRYERLFWIVSIIDQCCRTCQAVVSDPLHIPLYNLCSSGQYHLSLQERPGKYQNTPGASQKPHGDICKHTLTAYLLSKPSTIPSVQRVWPVLGNSLGQHPGCRLLPRAPCLPLQLAQKARSSLAAGTLILHKRAQAISSNVNMRAGFDAIRFSEI